MDAVLGWGFWYLFLYLIVGRATSINLGPLRIVYGGEKSNRHNDKLSKPQWPLPMKHNRFRKLRGTEKDTAGGGASEHKLIAGA